MVSAAAMQAPARIMSAARITALVPAPVTSTPVMRDKALGRVCFADGREARRAYAQLEALEPEMREGGMVYKCLPGQHDDLGISCAMLNWAARHPHLDYWMGNMLAT